MENSITRWKRYASVQPPMMVLFFAQSMSGNILTDMITYRTCTITLGLNSSVCSLLHENSSSADALDIDTKVQPQASLILASKSFIESILPSILSLFLGPWSDIYGRKPLILSGYIGTSLTFFTLSVMSSWNISPWFLLLAYLPSALMGGYCILILASVCYIADITEEKDRAWQLAWLEVLVSLGVLLGLSSSPILFQAYGYVVIFSTATVCCTAAGLYVLFCVPETIHNTNQSRTLSSLFNVTLVKELINTCIKKREGFNRCVVWSCIASLTLLVVTLQGEINVGLLFTSARLGWDVNKYSIYMAANITFSIFGTIIGVFILKTLAGVSEEAISVLSLLSALGAAFTRAFTYKDWHLYLSVGVGIFGGAAPPMIRAILSKSVPSEAAGKVFSLTTSIETLTPFGASSLYAMIYATYMPPLYPSPVWLVSAGFFIIAIALVINIKIQGRRYAQGYLPLNQDSE